MHYSQVNIEPLFGSVSSEMEFLQWWVKISLNFGQKLTYVLKGNYCILLLEIIMCWAEKYWVHLEPVCCKKQQKKFLTSYWFAE